MPRLVSRFITLAYYTRKCSFLFSPGDGTNATAPYGIAAGKTAADVNAYTGGWFNVNTTRLVWTNSQFDMWRDATVSADTRPGGPLVSTPEAPVNVIPGGNHGNDMLTRWGQENPAVKAVQDAEIAVISQWVDEFYTEKNITRGRGSRH